MKSKFRTGNEWKTLLELPKKRNSYAMVAIGNDRIAIVGGESGEGFLDIYHLKRKEWSSFKMKEKRFECAAVAIDEKLFVFGGRYNYHGGCLSSCEMYDLHDTSHEPHILPLLSEGICGLAAVVYERTNVVVLGGENERCDTLANACMFDTINEEWIELPSMPTPRSLLAAGVSGSYIIAAGGVGGRKTVEILDMQTRTWKRVVDMNNDRFSHGGAVIGDSTNSSHMIVAGSACCHPYTSCEIYSFRNNSWSTLPNLQSNSRSRQRIASLFRQLVVMDGMLVAGGAKRLETLDLSTPELIYELVRFVVELDLVSSCKKLSCKMDSCTTVVKEAKRD